MNPILMFYWMLDYSWLNQRGRLCLGGGSSLDIKLRTGSNLNWLNDDDDEWWRWVMKMSDEGGSDLSVESVWREQLSDGHLVLGQSSRLVWTDHVTAAWRSEAQQER